MTRSDVWTMFPVAALLGFAGWVTLMATTGDPAAVVLFVAVFLAGAWKVCRWYHQVDEVDEHSFLEEPPTWWLE